MEVKKGHRKTIYNPIPCNTFQRFIINNFWAHLESCLQCLMSKSMWNEPSSFKIGISFLPVIPAFQLFNLRTFVYRNYMMHVWIPLDVLVKVLCCCISRTRAFQNAQSLFQSLKDVPHSSAALKQLHLIYFISEH